MKIAFIGQKGIPGKSGGIEKHVENLSVGLVKRGHEVIVFSRSHYTPATEVSYKGVTLVNLPSVATKNLDAISHTFFAIIYLLRRDVDIIHFHGIGPSSLIWLAKLLKPKTKVMATFHCQDYFHKKWGSFAKMYLKFGERVACTISDMVITVSLTLQKYVDDTYKRSSVYIPNGVLPSVYEPVDEIQQWGLEKGNYILAVSRLIPHKGIELLLRSFATTPTDKKLVVVGGGAFTDDYVQKLNLLAADDSRVIMVGEQRGKVLRELFSNALFFVQPSESEGLSIALLEAMSYGKTALISDIPENKEAIGDHGFSFKNKNQEDLSQKISLLVSSEEILSIKGMAAQKRTIDFYNWEEIIKNTEDLYENVLLQDFSKKIEGMKFASRVGSFL